MNKKLFSYLYMSIILGIGILMGYSLAIRYRCESRIKRIEVEKEVIKEVSACDKTQSSAERAICFAQEACHGNLKNFNYDGSLSGKITFNCEK